MFNRFRKKSELEERNKSLIQKNAELVKTIEELRFEISELKKNYDSLVSATNEILAKRSEDQSASLSDSNHFQKVLEIEDSNCSEIYWDTLTSRIVALDENEELKKINQITSKYYPVPINEDDNNVVIRYYRYDETLKRSVRNTKAWKERLTIHGERYYLIIESWDNGERVWNISLKRYFQAPMPPNYKLKALSDKGEEFEKNEDIATGDTQSISVAIELEEGEGLKLEIYPEPDDYLASRIFWFY